MMMMQDNMILFCDFFISLSPDFLLSIADDTPRFKGRPEHYPRNFFYMHHCRRQRRS
jgi:hypothetical protein